MMTVEHPLTMSYGPIPGVVILALTLGTATVFFLLQVRKATRLVMLGAPDDRFDSWGQRVRLMIVGWLGQQRVLRDKVAGGLHVLMFWGFLMLISDGLDLVTAGWFSRALLTPIGVAGLWNGIVELGYTMAGIGATGALIRRVAFTPEKLKGKPQLEGNVILLLILTIVTTSYLVEAHESPSPRWEPIGAWFASILADSPMFEEIVVASYWAHMLAISTFLFLIPVSKHMHLVMAVPNVFFHDTRPMATMLPIDYTTDKGQDWICPACSSSNTKDQVACATCGAKRQVRLKATPLEDLEVETFGASTYTELTWRQLIDGWSCTSCARCQDVCPAYASGKPLNPMQIIHDVRNYANEHHVSLLAGEAPEEDMIARFGEASIFACTTCHACVDVCPLYIEHVPKLTDARRHLMMERLEFDEEVEEVIAPLLGALENIENDSNPYGIPAHERGDWAEGLDVKVAEPAEYVYFAGCAASFDERNKSVARSTISIMKEAGLDVSILGMEEGCSGDPARRAGNEYLFQMLAETNLATFEELGVKRIVASCPHCFHTLGKEYGDYGGQDLEVIHHSQIINTLQKEGRIPIPDVDGSVTFHDPCYLGRIGGEVDAPRQAIGGVDVEPDRHGRDSFCCGAGGAQMWMEEHAPKERVNVIRAKELAATGADTVAVGCPFCSTMVTDGLAAIDATMEVKDVAELVWEQIKANDALIQAERETMAIEP